MGSAAGLTEAMLDDGTIRKIGNGRTTAYVRND